MYTISIILFFLSCNNSKKSTPEAVEMPNANINKVNVYDFSEDTIRPITDLANELFINSEHVKKWFIDYIFEQPESELHEIIVNSLGDTEIQSYGNMQIYEIDLSEEFPGGMTKSFCIFYSKNKQEAYIFTIESYQQIKVQSNSLSYVVGGFADLRGKEYFLIYNYDGSNFIKNFDSIKFCDMYGLYMANYRAECIEYNPLRLKYKNLDINNDGFLDLVFSGTFLNYCPPGADKDETNMKPLISMSLNLIFMYHPEKNTWTISDQEICKLFYTDY